MFHDIPIYHLFRHQVLVVFWDGNPETELSTEKASFDTNSHVERKSFRPLDYEQF